MAHTQRTAGSELSGRAEDGGRGRRSASRDGRRSRGREKRRGHVTGPKKSDGERAQGALSSWLAGLLVVSRP